MRRRVLSAMLVVAAVAVIGFGIPLGVAVQSMYRDEALLVLSKEAARAVVAVPASFATGNDHPELPTAAPHVDVALYGADARKLQGAGPDIGDGSVVAALHGLQRSSGTGLVVAAPVSREEAIVGAVRASMPTGVVAARTHHTWLAMGVLGLAVAAAAGFLAARLSRTLTRPLLRLAEEAAVIGGGGEVASWSGSTTAEIGTVHHALRDASTRLGAALVRERAFSADVAHQLRTPLASLRLRLETEQYQGDPGGTLIDDAIRDVERLDQTITDLLALARDRIETHETHPLATSVRETVNRWERKLGSNCRLLVECEPQLPWVQASPAAIRQILDVLIDNAVTHASGEIRLSAYRVGTGSVIAVADHGTTVVDPDRIFERRHSESAGSGIGLALARRLAEAEDLRLVVAQPGPGVVFHLIFGGPPVPPRSGRVERDD
ncbi:MAG: sensor histidine kinase [Acidimicrobiales bacterium]